VTRRSPQELTQLVHAWCGGNRAALDTPMALVYGELLKLAHRYMLRERPGHLLQSSALVNEAYLQLIESSQVQWRDWDLAKTWLYRGMRDEEKRWIRNGGGR